MVPCCPNFARSSRWKITGVWPSAPVIRAEGGEISIPPPSGLAWRRHRNSEIVVRYGHSKSFKIIETGTNRQPVHAMLAIVVPGLPDDETA